ncbi:MAG: flagellar basal body-associated FliL family protein [Acidobacteria bacterium]|nr:flagellar basal body-associated FliL family protein [Acidobacteriota bacterium]
MDESKPAAATAAQKPGAAAPDKKPAPNASKKKGKFGLILGIVIGVLVLAGGGAAAYWKLRPAPPAPAAGGAAGEGHGVAEAAETHPAGVVSFEPFLVNLAGGSGQTYLRVTLKLLVGSEEDAKLLQESEVAKARMRSAILEVLATQSADTLVTVEGKAQLKKALVEQVSALKQKTEVRDVLFSDFVVQF